MNIEPADYQRIAEMIHSDNSPVGIDARKTHIYIIHMLEQITQRLEKLESRQSPGSSN